MSRRIAILANSSGGKSTLARRLAAETGLPPTKRLFETIWTVDRDLMPAVRRLVEERERAGRDARRLTALAEVEVFRL